VRNAVAKRRRGRIICFRRGEFLLERERRRRIEPGGSRLGRGLAVSSPEPVSLSARTSWSTATILVIARSLALKRVCLASWPNEIAADFGDDS
jgi:hypothetical protein